MIEAISKQSISIYFGRPVVLPARLSHHTSQASSTPKNQSHHILDLLTQWDRVHFGSADTAAFQTLI
jgi:hypothetical protein